MVTLKWKAIDGAAKYNLQVASNPDFNRTLLAHTTQQNKLETELKSGIYFLRVQGVDSRGQVGLWSEPFRLAVTAPITAPPVNQAPQQVSYIAKTPQVFTTWKSPEPAAHYQVRIERDGKEVLKQNTSVPKIDFVPAEPGEYKVEVRSGIGDQFGPAVTVDRIVVEKKDLVPPRWNLDHPKRYTNKKPVSLKWSAVPGAEKYHLVISEERRDPDSDVTTRVAVATQDVTDAAISLPALPPGHYTAVVESVSGKDRANSNTEYQFEVKRAKPVEFDRVDLTFRLTTTPLNYRANLLEGGGTGSYFYTVAESVQVDGTMWLPDSNWGLQAGGSWGGFTVQENAVTYNDLQAAAAYRYSFSWTGYKSELKPYIGARAWNVPLILANSGGSGSSGSGSPGNSNNGSSVQSSVQISDVTLLGPVLGASFVKPFSDKLAVTAMAQISVPLTNSTPGGGALASFTATPTVNPKVEVGVKYALPGTLRLVGSVGYQQENLNWSTLTVNGNSGNSLYVPPAGSTSNITINDTNFTVGIEVSDEGPLFRSSDDVALRAERFSDFDFNLRYVYTPASYTSAYVYDAASSGSLPIQYGGALELDTAGWFKDSHHGIRFLAAWNGFTFNNSNISNPEFYAQWGYRPQTFKKTSGWSLKNEFGARAWRMEVISFDGNNGVVSKTGAFNLSSPQLVGAAEDVQLTKDLGANWSAKLSLEGSAPLFFADKGSTVSTLYTTFSYKTELAAIKTFSEDLSAGLGAGYKSDQFQFGVPGAAGVSSVGITSPTLSLFGTYFF